MVEIRTLTSVVVDLWNMQYAHRQEMFSKKKMFFFLVSECSNFFEICKWYTVIICILSLCFVPVGSV